MSNFVAIVQARMGSTRLPGKAMMEIGGKPCLYHVVNRIRKAQRINEVIIATPDNPNNEPIWDYCQQNNILCFAGDEEDVLKRVRDAAALYSVDNIVDITADCPLVDPYMLDEMIASHTRNNADLTSNVVKRCWPDGFDIQIYKREILEALNVLVENKTHRLHTGWNILNYLIKIEEHLQRFLFISSHLPSGKYFKPDWRITLDTKEDALVIDDILKNLGEDCNWKQIMDYLEQHPEKRWNANIIGKVPGEG